MRIQMKEVVLKTAHGDLEAILDLPSDPHPIEQSEYLAVCCHPHSLHGGTLTNKVVYTLSRTMASNGVPSIRFNFRGVGKSDGEYDNGIGEQHDLAFVVSWMREKYPNKQLILGGFSFGAFVSIMASTKLQPKKLISIAPPVGRFDFSITNAPSCPWLVIQGNEDELVKCEEVESWTNDFGDQLRFIKVQGASHFFHGKLVELRSILESFISFE